MKKIEKYLLEKTRSKVSKAIEDFQLIKNNDRVMVAISGGKDSMALLDILNNRKKALKIDYQIKAIHIKLTDIPYYTDHRALLKFCKKRGIEFEIISTNKKISREGKQPCFYCAWNRRKLIFKYAQEHNYNKIAFGHHKDDAVETLLMNMIYHAEISSFPAKIQMFENAFEIIRPLIYLTDKELKKYVQLIDYTPIPYDCPFAKENKREHFKQLLSNITKLNKNGVANIFKSMEHIYKEHLPVK